MHKNQKGFGKGLTKSTNSDTLIQEGEALKSSSANACEKLQKITLLGRNNIMKKVIALLLSMTMVIGMLAGCGAKETTSDAPASETNEAAAPAADGSVYYLNFKPEQDAAWQALAKSYTEQTGAVSYTHLRAHET